MTISFGFEAEFQTRVDNLIALLTERGLAQSERRHNYHCDCSTCGAIFPLDDNWNHNGMPQVTFRAQNDSSCGGEVISCVFTDDDWGTAIAAIEALGSAAGDEDGGGVRAGLSSDTGFHVHVAEVGQPLTNTVMERVAGAYLGIERHVSGTLGAGLYSAKRDMNYTLLGSVYRYMLSFIGASGIANAVEYLGTPREYSDLPERLLMRDPDQPGFYRARVLRTIVTSILNDRHCDLNFSQGHGTVEVRVFNGTRMAWRMEMNCRFAAWFMAHIEPLADLCRVHYSTWPEILASLNATTARSQRQPTQATVEPVLSWDELVEMIHNDDPRLAELMCRQKDYLDGRLASLPLTVGAMVS